MNLKLYLVINIKILQLILFSFILSFLIISSASGATLTSTVISNTSIFKCQGTTISVTFTGSVTTADMILSDNSSVNLSQHSMTNMGSGVWNVSYGNNASIPFGWKIISFMTTNGGTQYFDSGRAILVYSDSCTGNISTYQEIPSGLGNYTNQIYTSNISLLRWGIYPYEQYWGYLFYVIVGCMLFVAIYHRTENIMQPLFVALLYGIAINQADFIPQEYKYYIQALCGIIIGAIIVKAFTNERGQ